jgi:serine/threonine protein kinase
MTNQLISGRYRLERTVGQGAGGAVWLAHDDLLDRAVALKRIGGVPGSAAAEDAVRAEREARLAAQLGHPNVVSVYDLVTDDDGAWLVMEYVEGPALSSAVRLNGPFSPDEAARLLAPVADALVQAHALGIVHRDVKPSNILAGDGGAKLTDFGIARGAEDATLTRTGLVTGSPAYLAPEVAMGGQATVASDVWAFGATLVHLVTGQPPYHHEDKDNGPLAVVYRIAHEDPPRPEEAGWLGPLIAAAMTKDPAQRPSMAAVRDHLSRTTLVAEQTAVLPPVPLSTPLPAPAPLPAQPPTRSRAPMIAAAVALLVLVVVIGAIALTRGGDDQPTGRTTPSPTGTTKSSGTTQASAPTAAELEDFARRYVATASRDPKAGFAMLTPAYQRRSPEYAAFWGAMKNPEILTVSADPAALTVTYTYRYVFPGKGRRTETVTLRLVRVDGRLLIDGA